MIRSQVNWIFSCSPADPGMSRGVVSIPGPGGAFIAGDPEINPRYVYFTSTAVMLLE